MKFHSGLLRLIDNNHSYAYYSPVTLEDLRRAITIVDPEITETDLDRYLHFGFNITGGKESLDDVQPMELKVLLSRLQHGTLRRIGKMT